MPRMTREQRKNQIVHLHHQGNTDEQIAHMLNLTVRTVAGYLRGMRSSTAAPKQMMQQATGNGTVAGHIASDDAAGIETWNDSWVPKTDSYSIMEMSHAEREALARYPHTPPEILTSLARSEEHNIRDAVAANPNTPHAVLYELYDDQNWHVRGCVARNPGIPEDLLGLIASRHSVAPYPASLAAQHPKATPEMLQRLIHQDYTLGDARRHALAHPNLPAETLREVAAESDHPTDLFAVASNPGCPADVLEELAGHRDQVIRGAVAANPNAPVHLLDRLAREPVSEGGFMHVNHMVSLNRNTSSETLAWLARNIENLHREVAQHPNSSDETLSELSESSVLAVRAAAQNTINGWLTRHHLSSEHQAILDEHDLIVRLRHMLEGNGPVFASSTLRAMQGQAAADAEAAGLGYLLR